MKEIIVIIIFVLLIVFAVGGVIWMFVKEDLQTKNYIKFMIELEKIDKGKQSSKEEKIDGEF